MENPSWSRDRVIDLVAGTTTYLRNLDTTVAACPPWLGDAEGMTLGQSDTGERLGAIHPADRDAYFAGWLGAAGTPGEVFEADYRITGEGGEWATERARFVNLTGCSDLEAMVVAVEQTSDVRTLIAQPRQPIESAYVRVPWIACTLDHHCRITTIDGDVEAVLGRARAEVIGRMPMEFMHPSEWSRVTEQGLRLLETPGITITSRRSYVHPDGTELWVETTEVNRMDPATGEGDILTISVDITERLAQEHLIRTSHEQFRLLAEEMGTAVFLADRQANLTFRNPQFDELFAGADGITVLTDLFDPTDGELVHHHLRRLIEREGADRFELEARAADGETVLSLTCRAVGDDGDVTGLVGSVIDVTATVELRRRADHDVLTGLYNRVAFEERLQEILDHAPRDALVLFVDLDGFKAVNDTYGHSIGDHVLRHVARRLTHALRPTDIVGRYGGDEFVMVCTEVYGGEARIRDRLAGALVAPIEWDGGSWSPSASIGAARPASGDTVHEVLARADEAMFDIKRLRPSRSGTIRL